MSRRRLVCIATVLILGIATVIPAQADYRAGRTAWDAGRHGEAVTQWRAAARAQDVRAMLALGRAFAKGVGVPQDFVEAHKWLNLAAGRGSAEGAAERDALKPEMTVEERAEARKLARAWRIAATQAKPQPKPAAPARKAAKPKKPAPAGPPPKRALREAQGLLAGLGYAPGPADGVWRPDSARAYRAFLGKAGLTPGDVLTPAGLRALRRVAKDKAAAARSSGERLHRAVQAGDIDGLKAALKAGANANARDRRGWTALMRAANKGYTLMVAPLLAAKADPDVRAADGATALFMAAAHGHREIIELLMKGGAGVAIKGPQGRTAVEIARLRYGNAAAARKKGAGDALVALLNGRSWAHVVAARAAAEKAAAVETAMKLTPADRKSIQAALGALGHSPGPADGVFGPATRSALRSWQKAQGLNPTGRVNPAVAAKLKAAAEKLAREKAAQERFERSLTAGKTFRERNCPDCPEMVVVPAGSFTMGGDLSDEQPRHRVTIRRPFAVGKYEVTFAEWDACVSAGGCRHRPGDRDWGRGRRPVIDVNWHDAKAYVSWLSRRTGKRYRLLSESEWEYAARAETRTRYHWGDSIGHNRANCDGCGSRWDNRRTAPVGSFGANRFGLHDVHGNVWEWVVDCWRDSYRGAPSDGRARTTGGDCGLRVLRGGSWDGEPRSLRAADRYWFTAGNRSNDMGFRVARTLAP